MTKHVFTKRQAISILDQVKTTKEVDIFKPVDTQHKLFKLSCDDLEKELVRYLGANQIAGVVEEV